MNQLGFQHGIESRHEGALIRVRGQFVATNAQLLSTSPLVQFLRVLDNSVALVSGMGSAGMSGFEAAGEWAWPYRGIRSQVRQHDAAVAPMFSVADTRQATKALAATPRNSRERVALKMAELAPDPSGAANAKTLVGEPG